MQKSFSDVTLPETLQFIGCDAFSECTSLSQIEIPDSVTYIAYDAFSISGIVDIKLSKILRKLMVEHFIGVRIKKRLKYRKSNKSGSRAFYASSSLEKVSLPDN